VERMKTPRTGNHSWHEKARGDGWQIRGATLRMPSACQASYYADVIHKLSNDAPITYGCSICHGDMVNGTGWRQFRQGTLFDKRRRCCHAGWRA